MKNPTEDIAFCRDTKLLRLFGEWHDACCPRKNNTMALASALGAFGTIMGRTYVGSKSTRAGLYIAALSPPGGGKDGPRYMAKHLLTKLDRAPSIGADEWGSDSGMITSLSESKEILWQVDEFWKLLRDWQGTNMASYKAGIASLLLQWYSGKTWNGRALKENSIPPIENPHVNLVATSQIDTWWTYVTMEMVATGLLSRFIILEEPQYSRMTLDDAELSQSTETTMPPEIVTTINKMLESDCSLLQRVLETGNQVRMTYEESDLAEIQALHDMIENKLQDPFLEQFGKSVSAREWEKTYRLAMVHAWSKGDGRNKIGADSIKWAYKLVEYTSYLCMANTRRMSGNDYEKAYDRITRRIYNTGERGITQRLLVQMGLRDLDKVLEQLLKAHLVEMKVGDRLAKTFYWRGKAEEPKEKLDG